MRLIDLKYRLEYGVVRTVAWLVAQLPLETASNLSGVIWRRIAPFLGRHDRAMAHLAAAFPEMSETERQRIFSEWRVATDELEKENLLERLTSASEAVASAREDGL